MARYGDKMQRFQSFEQGRNAADTDKRSDCGDKGYRVESHGVNRQERRDYKALTSQGVRFNPENPFPQPMSEIPGGACLFYF
jgi:hypothetical protein